jgi:hypothetical protein
MLNSPQPGRLYPSRPEHDQPQPVGQHGGDRKHGHGEQGKLLHDLAEHRPITLGPVDQAAECGHAGGINRRIDGIDGQ